MPGRRVIGAWLALVVFAAVFHLWGLGERSFHHDEAIHAKLSYDLAFHGRYRYDPTYHGPLLYYLTAATYHVVGDSDFTARLPIALAGIALVGVAWRLRRIIGGRAAWWTGLLLSISPTMLFFGRFLRMDILELLTASLAIISGIELIRGRRQAAVGLGLWTGLAVATKENVYVTAALLGATAVCIALTAGLSESVFAVRRWLERHWRDALLAAAVCLAVVLPLYTVGFTRLEDAAFPVRAISYWWQQHDIQRVGGPWWFHLPRLVQYELPILAAAMVWVLRRGRRMRRLEVGLFFFGLASIGMYCYLGEKVPWLAVHQVWAFVPLAGAQLARTFGPSGRWWSRGVAAVGLSVLASTTFVASFVLDEITPTRPRVESLHFVQTCPELAEVAREVANGKMQDGDGPLAAVAGEAAWPLTWYWRGLNINWAPPRPGVRPPLVVCNPDDEVTLRRTLGVGYDRRRIALRAWWLMYQARPSIREVVRYATVREPWGGIGSTDVIVLRRTEEALDIVIEDAQVPRAAEELLGVVSARVVGRGWLAEPRGIAMRNRRMAIADSGLSQLVLIDEKGRLMTTGELPPLNQPEDVDWVDEDRVVVADTWNHRVLEVELTTGTSRDLPPPSGGWYGPRSVAVADSGLLAVSDTGNKRIVVAEGVGEPWRSLDEDVVEPGGVAWADDGALLVCDTGNRRIRRVNLVGEVVANLSIDEGWTDFYSRPQVAVNAKGTVVVSDTPGRALWVLRDGSMRRIAVDDADLQPTGVAWSEDGRTLAVGDLSGRVWLLEVGDG